MARRFYPPTESDIPMHGWRPYHDIHRERIRAHDLHDDNGESMERRVWDDPAWVPTVLEELGEVAKEINEIRHGNSSGYTHLRKELVQTAAMCAAWIEAIDLDGR